MRPLRPIATALVATAALAAPATAGAAAGFHVTQARFDVTVEGRQVSTWTHQHTARGGCDSNSEGGGREVMRFTSKPTRMSAFRVTPGGGIPVFHRIGAPLGKSAIPLHTRITRSGSYKTWGGPVCSYGDGTGTTTEQPKDCGTRTSNRLAAELQYDFKGKQVLGLNSDFGHAPDPFANCPSGPMMFPNVLTYGKGLKPLGRKLPYRDLFRGPRKNILRFGTTLPNDTFETPAKTRVSYEITITRVGH
jgi:hypothetical protein